ncbi:MAG: autotransporter assembly complex family protein [Fluviicoccus sp.]|uniref:autotransporter assembly complex protein TamA n=1 Tax=Fluviicoccus sp. TaxID=2003552 RepID=UPI00271FAE9E|nr:autotransporter assembly complex family protein [Fluviicoccus sp.]MDO8329011.1 autotransporter assembly complex family protein [Fluviicoccus sp.]
MLDWKKRIFLVMTCVCGPVLAQDDVPVRIEGVTNETKANLEAYFGKLTHDDLLNWRDTHARLKRAAREAMQSVGYYQSTVHFTPQAAQVLVDVQPGEPVIIKKLELRYQGDAGNDIAFTALLETLPLHEGEVLHHGRYEAIKTLVQNMALERGYFGGQWTLHEVKVLQPAQTAEIRLEYNSGSRYRFGDVEFTTPSDAEPLPLKIEWLEKLKTFSPDDPYEASRIIEFNKALLDSRYFNDVRVRAEPDLAKDQRVPVHVRLSAAKPNQLEVGVGYATDIGPRLSLAWRRPLLNDRGHSIETSTEISQVRQSATFRYGIPWTHPLNDTLQIFSGFKREVLDEATTYSNTLGVERLIRRADGWQRGYSLRFSNEISRKTTGEEVTNNLLLPGLNLNRTRSRGGADPYWGDRQYYQTELASRSLLSDAEFLSLRAGWRLLRTYADRHMLLLRSDLGAIVSSDFDSVPLNMRFYAGGDQSVRGFDYQSLSPRDSTGQVVGASNLVTASSEYAYRLTKRWRLATFVDTGNAFDSASDGLATGAGVGVRWISPVGPVRFDIAWPVSESGSTSPRIHFFMGPAL